MKKLNILNGLVCGVLSLLLFAMGIYFIQLAGFSFDNSILNIVNLEITNIAIFLGFLTVSIYLYVLSINKFVGDIEYKGKHLKLNKAGTVIRKVFEFIIVSGLIAGLIYTFIARIDLIDFITNGSASVVLLTGIGVIALFIEFLYALIGLIKLIKFKPRKSKKSVKVETPSTIGKIVTKLPSDTKNPVFKFGKK